MNILPVLKNDKYPRQAFSLAGCSVPWHVNNILGEVFLKEAIVGVWGVGGVCVSDGEGEGCE